MAITNEQISKFVAANIDDPQAIIDAANEFGISISDLSEATGYSRSQLNEYVATPQGDFEGAVAQEVLPTEELNIISSGNDESSNVLSTRDTVGLIEGGRDTQPPATGSFKTLAFEFGSGLSGMMDQFSNSGVLDTYLDYQDITNIDTFDTGMSQLDLGNQLDIGLGNQVHNQAGNMDTGLLGVGSMNTGAGIDQTTLQDGYHWAMNWDTGDWFQKLDYSGDGMDTGGMDTGGMDTGGMDTGGMDTSGMGTSGMGTSGVTNIGNSGSYIDPNGNITIVIDGRDTSGIFDQGLNNFDPANLPTMDTASAQLAASAGGSVDSNAPISGMSQDQLSEFVGDLQVSEDEFKDKLIKYVYEGYPNTAVFNYRAYASLGISPTYYKDSTGKSPASGDTQAYVFALNFNQWIEDTEAKRIEDREIAKSTGASHTGETIRKAINDSPQLTASEILELADKHYVPKENIALALGVSEVDLDKKLVEITEGMPKGGSTPSLKTLDIKDTGKLNLRDIDFKRPNWGYNSDGSVAEGDWYDQTVYRTFEDKTPNQFLREKHPAMYQDGDKTESQRAAYADDLAFASRVVKTHWDAIEFKHNLSQFQLGNVTAAQLVASTAQLARIHSKMLSDHDESGYNVRDETGLVISGERLLKLASGDGTPLTIENLNDFLNTEGTSFSKEDIEALGGEYTGGETLGGETLGGETLGGETAGGGSFDLRGWVEDIRAEGGDWSTNSGVQTLPPDPNTLSSESPPETQLLPWIIDPTALVRNTETGQIGTVENGVFNPFSGVVGGGGTDAVAFIDGTYAVDAPANNLFPSSLKDLPMGLGLVFSGVESINDLTDISGDVSADDILQIAVKNSLIKNFIDAGTGIALPVWAAMYGITGNSIGSIVEGSLSNDGLLATLKEGMDNSVAASVGSTILDVADWAINQVSEGSGTEPAEGSGTEPAEGSGTEPAGGSGTEPAGESAFQGDYDDGRSLSDILSDFRDELTGDYDEAISNIPDHTQPTQPTQPTPAYDDTGVKERLGLLEEWQLRELPQPDPLFQMPDGILSGNTTITDSGLFDDRFGHREKLRDTTGNPATRMPDVFSQGKAEKIATGIDSQPEATMDTLAVRFGQSFSGRAKQSEVQDGAGLMGTRLESSDYYPKGLLDKAKSPAGIKLEGD